MINLSSSEGANLLNIQYGVCFGVIFSLCFIHNSDHTTFAVSISNVFPFLALLLYFFLDWLLANFLRDKIQFNIFLLLGWSLTIWFLGTVVNLVNSVSPAKYVLVASYAFVVGLYHLTAYCSKLYPIDQGPKVVGILLSAPLVLLGLYFLAQTLPPVLHAAGTETEVASILGYIVAGMIILKLLSIWNLYIQLRPE